VCDASAIERENCVLRCVRSEGIGAGEAVATERLSSRSCLSTQCYERVYGSDALEEGEVDTVRGRLFRACLRAELHTSVLQSAHASLT